MPPKARFSKDAILDKAKAIASKEGIENLNARRLAKALDSSTQPIFSYYSNMQAFKQDLLNYEGSIFIQTYLSIMEKKGLKNSFLWLSSFALSSPKEFHNLFSKDFYGENMKKALNDSLPRIALVVSKQQKLSYELANIFYLQNWVFAFGLASLLADNQFLGNENVVEGLLQNQMDNVLVKLKETKKR
jgi:AcrR family transcriptional regulator